MFKDILRELRESKNLYQEELGKIIGKSKSTIGMYETGKRMPTDKTLAKLSSFFEVSVDYLLGLQADYIPTNNIELSKYELELYKKFKTLDERGKQTVIDTIEREYKNTRKDFTLEVAKEIS